MLKQRLLMAAAKGGAPSTSFKIYGLGNNNTLFNTAGTTTTPAQIGSSKVWKSASAEQNAAYYVKDDGTLWYTGAPGGGVLSTVGTPTQAGSATTWKQVASNYNCSIAVRTDGSLWSWGANSNGSTGQGTTSGNTTFATRIGSGTNWKSVACSFYCSFAIKTDGTLWSWGNNTSFGTGLNTDVGTTTTPTQVGTDTDWSILGQSGGYCGFAIKTNGTLWGWGSGLTYQQGNGSTADVTVPTQIGSATTWVSVGNINDGGSAGATCGVQVSGGNRTLWSWGTNAGGWAGQGTTVGNTTTPTQIGSATNWSEVSGGSIQSFVARRTDGTIWGWGTNANGTTGQGTTSGNTTSPTQIGSATTWVAGIINGVYNVILLST